MQLAAFDAHKMFNELVKDFSLSIFFFFLEGKKSLSILHLVKYRCDDLPEKYLYYFPE